jgi:hypothetical protein
MGLEIVEEIQSDSEVGERGRSCRTAQARQSASTPEGPNPSLDRLGLTKASGSAGRRFEGVRSGAGGDASGTASGLAVQHEATRSDDGTQSGGEGRGWGRHLGAVRMGVASVDLKFRAAHTAQRLAGHGGHFSRSEAGDDSIWGRWARTASASRRSHEASP